MSIAWLDLVAVPMKAAFGHARANRKLAESVIVRIADGEHTGAGECVARDYVTGETPESAFAAISALDLDELVAVTRAPTFADAVRAIEALELPARLGGLAAAACVELALLDLAGHRTGASIRDAAAALGLPDALLADRGARHHLTRALDTNRTPEQLVSDDMLRGFDVLKIKVGLGRDVDVERVRAARALAGDAMTVTVDGNMAWSLDEACTMAALLEPFAIAWYEEPLARGALAAYREFRERTGGRVMLDESLCSASDAHAAIAAGACDLFNIRLAKCGGFLPSLRLAELAQRHGLGYQLGTHPGAQAILRAAEWGFVHTVAGFATVEAARSRVWFDDEMIRETLAVDYSASRVVPLDGAGLGVTVIDDRIDAISQRRATWTAGAWTVTFRRA